MLKYNLLHKDTYLGKLSDFEDKTGVFTHISYEECVKISEKEDLDVECLWDLLEGIKEDIEEQSAEKNFDSYKYTKYWVNDFRFVIA